MDPLGIEDLTAKVMTTLRMSSDKLRSEVSDNVLAAITDLKTAGIVVTFDEVTHACDPLITQAVRIYCRAYFGTDESADRFRQSYEMLKCSLMLSGDHNGTTA